MKRQQSSFKRGERVIVNQTNIGTVSEATFGKLPERPGGFSVRTDTILN